MVYLVTITSLFDSKSFHVRGLHNALAYEEALKGDSSVSVTIDPDVFAYLRLSATPVAA